MKITAARYLRRYTNDYTLIAASNNLDELKGSSDYKVHIWDTRLNRVVWQNAPSVRFGNTCLVQVKELPP